MLQFWKKSSGRNIPKSVSPTKQPPEVHKIERPTTSKGSAPLSAFENESLYDIDEFESTKERSRLPKTLSDLVNDKSALGYFVQFMEVQRAAHYIHGWLDIESFKSDIDHMKKPSPDLSPLADHDSLSVSTDCDSITTDTNSLHDFSSSISEGRVTSCNSECNMKCDNSRNLSDSSPKVQNGCSETNSMTDEALAIFKKYIALEAPRSVKCSDSVRNSIIENVCDFTKVLSGDCFDAVQLYLTEIIEREYFGPFLGSDHFCKHQIDVLTSGNVALDDILYNETALFYFMEYLEQENSRSLLDFWIAATNLQQQLKDQQDFFDPLEAQNDAVVLYDKYFSLQAHCPLGFSDKVRFDVEQNICGENGLVLDCFYVPLKIVEQVLERHYLKPFQTSQLFYKYLSELIHTVQSNGYATNNHEKNASPSDCSSEKSFSTNNTFLALDMNEGVFKQRSNNMSIDTRQLCDPDSLWKRKRSHLLLSCGRVSALGKFESDLEPEPVRGEFSLKKVVRKFVSLDEEEKKKEDMAWQVAEMIVKDITSITLDQSNRPSTLD